jgi:SNF2 family DNA or RNA helicase
MVVESAEEKQAKKKKEARDILYKDTVTWRRLKASCQTKSCSWIEPSTLLIDLSKTMDRLAQVNPFAQNKKNNCAHDFNSNSSSMSASDSDSDKKTNISVVLSTNGTKKPPRPTNAGTLSSMLKNVTIDNSKPRSSFFDRLNDKNVAKSSALGESRQSASRHSSAIKVKTNPYPDASSKVSPVSRLQQSAGLRRPPAPSSAIPAMHYSKGQKQHSLSSSQARTLSLFDPIEPGSKTWGTRISIDHYKNQQIDTISTDLNSLKKGKGTSLRLHSKSSIGSSPHSTGIDGSTKPNDSAKEDHISPQETIDSLNEIFDTFDRNYKNLDKISFGKGDVRGLKVKLLPHQIRGLVFLTQRESSKITQKGGFLCDDMGLGKTIQSISLILIKPYKEHLAVEKNTIKTTLVVAPLALIYQWANEIRHKAPGLSVLIYHGPNRGKFMDLFAEYDVVITTYSVVSIDHTKDNGVVQPVWWRVILDEAHTIKNPKANLSKAAYALRSNRRWCLTGTPIQNSVEDLHSLIKFLQIGPYNNQSVWNEQIATPMLLGNREAALQRLHVVLAGIMLRRTKAVLEEPGAFKLPQRNIHRRILSFSESEQMTYKKLEMQVVHTLLDEDKNYTAALVLLLRLRQVCDHPELVNRDISKELCSEDILQAVPDDADELVHDFESLVIKDKPRYKGPGYNTSTKINEVLKILKKEPQRKTIVFSQFTSMLDMIEPVFEAKKIIFTRYDGSMTTRKREQSLDRLREDPECTVLLCSLKCGALGLNLTCASQVVLIDPWWNPMVSEQAIDRVHRLGQTRDVDVYELVMAASVEERIMALQERKRNLAKTIVEKNGNSGLAKMSNTLSKEELFALFRGSI